MRRIPAVLLSLALSWVSAAQDAAPPPTVQAPTPTGTSAALPAPDAAAEKEDSRAASGPATARPILFPEELRPGDALLVRIPRSTSGSPREAVLRSPSDAVLQRSAGFLMGPDTEWEVFVFGLPMDAPPGTYAVELPGSVDGRTPSFRHTLTLRPRDFRGEDISLNADLTTLRTEPSERKDREARVYAEVLGRVDPRGVWLDGPFLRPLASERRTSHFGDRRRYLYATGGSASSVHAGIDFAAPTGTPVVAAGRGRVVLASDREVTGKTVVLEHLPGVYTIYMHLDTLSAAPGAVLERGAPLGTVGSTGLATGPHLHWELRVRGVACDPETPVFAAFQPGP
ncbi:MAG: M23 family metallopeptidase [Treponema sp.]|nr:M23 family metallopeptidase [Treponema sp.]